MPDEQDRAEALDEDKGAFLDEDPVIDVVDQTADAAAEVGTALDDDTPGSDLEGLEAEPDRAADPFHAEAPPQEVAAMHITEEPQR